MKDKRPVTDLVCPIFKVEGTGEPETDGVRQIYGTASFLADNIFITAGHCVPIEEVSTLKLGFPLPKELCKEKPQELGLVSIEAAECYKECDVGIVRVARSIPTIRPTKWLSETATALQDVWTLGYPHALDAASTGFLVQRAFKGHIITHGPYVPLNDNNYCVIYELPFLVPKGLSGAPLYRSGTPEAALGICVGTRETSMEICREVEASQENNDVTYVYHKHAVEFGMAVPSSVFLALQSTILGMTVGEFLTKHGLLIE